MPSVPRSALPSVVVALGLLHAAAAQTPEGPPAGEAPAKGHGTVTPPETDGERPDAAQPEIEAAERAIRDRTNAFRKEHKLGPTERDETLDEAAEAFARFMAEKNLYGHEADERTPDERVKAAGYDYCVVRENIAYAFRSDGFTTDRLADAFFTGWKESPEHRENMLAPEVTETAVAVVKREASDTYFAVQLFARPADAAITFSVRNESPETVAYRVDGRDFTLPPRYAGEHKVCVAREVVFLPAKEAGEETKPREAASGEAEPVARVTPSNGETLVVEAANGGGYRVRQAKP